MRPEGEDKPRSPEAVGERHRWFAWRPVLTPSGRQWLRMVVRQRWERSTGMDVDGQTTWWRERYWRYADLHPESQ